MLYIIDDLDKISEEEVERIVATLSQQRREQALRFKFALGKKTCALAYDLLCKGLREEYGIVDKPVFEYGEHGKPQIIGREDIHFNMSHCKKAVMCYVSNSPIGIDVETIGRDNKGLIEYTMCEEEIEQIHAAEKPDTEFIKLWTKKEAVLKLTGQGIIDDMKSVLSAENTSNIKIKTFVREDKGYVYSIAQYNQGIQVLRGSTCK